MDNYIEDIKLKIEAILFIGSEDIKIKDLSKFFNLPIDKLIPIIYELKGERKSSGINIEISDSNIYLVSNPKFGGLINSFFDQEKRPKKLSAATLETLSIIAYNQPITKSEVESIRGVNVDSIVSTLEGRKFVRICGKRDSVGKPNLYEVTDKFLGYLGIDSVYELPNYNEIKNKLDSFQVNN